MFSTAAGRRALTRSMPIAKGHVDFYWFGADDTGAAFCRRSPGFQGSITWSMIEN
jgi:hypothetical protein